MDRNEMDRIKIEQITPKENILSSGDTLRLVIIPDLGLEGGTLSNQLDNLKKETAVKDYKRKNFPLDLNMIFPFEEFLEIHVYRKKEKEDVFQYLDALHLSNEWRTDKIKKSSSYFHVQYQIESLYDKIEYEGQTDWSYFMLHKVTAHEIQEYGHDEIQLVIRADDKKHTFPRDKGYYRFAKGQTRNFYKARQKIKLRFKHKIKITVWEIDRGRDAWIDADDKLGSFTISNNPGDKEKSQHFHQKGVNYDFSYKLVPIMTTRQKERGSFRDGFELTPDTAYQKLNFNFFKNKMENLKDSLDELLGKEKFVGYHFVPAQLDLKPFLTMLAPERHNDTQRINQFISDYYTEVTENKEQQSDFIQSLMHSQYPVMAYPVYPEPVYYYLKKVNEKFILPASGELPNNSMTMFLNNPKFVEAFLAGMNTEMGRELLWREYPTDSRGSYFRKFWDTETGKNIKEEMKEEHFFDVLPLHEWTGQSGQNKHHLGQNHMPGKDDLLIFAIKGELLKKYPDTSIFLGKATLVDEVEIKINPQTEQKIMPELEAWLGADLFIVGFKAKLKDLVGNPQTKDPGYFLSFMSRPAETRFGVDKKNMNKQAANAGEQAANLLVEPYIYGKHVSQFLSGWQKIELD